MRTIKWCLESCLNGCDLEDEIQVEDDATEEDIDTLVREDMWNRVSLTWCELPPESTP